MVGSMLQVRVNVLDNLFNLRFALESPTSPANIGTIAVVMLAWSLGSTDWVQCISVYRHACVTEQTDVRVERG